MPVKTAKKIIKKFSVEGSKETYSITALVKNNEGQISSLGIKALKELRKGGIVYLGVSKVKRVV